MEDSHFAKIIDAFFFLLKGGKKEKKKSIARDMPEVIIQDPWSVPKPKDSARRHVGFLFSTPCFQSLASFGKREV